MKRCIVLSAALMLVAAAIPSQAAVVSMTVYPDDIAGYTNPAVGVPGGAAPGWDSGSWRANGSAVTELYLSGEDLAAALGRSDIKLGDIADISYWTKKSTPHTGSDVVDWFLTIYTTPFDGSPGSGWYGYRITSEPYFANNLSETVGKWNQWSIAGTQNQLRFFDSSSGYFGGYSDPLFGEFLIQDSARASGATMAGEPVLYFKLSTATGWADGFLGQVDGWRIDLTNGDQVLVNLETPEPTAVAGLLGLAICGAGTWWLRRRRAAA
ncbi:hypothetical protein JCM19992_25040 [Thermostilla marina]